MKKEMRELFVRMSKGDKEAREQIILMNQPLVKKIVMKYYKNQTHYENLFQEGMVFLILAVDRFELNKGFEFSTFAYRYIDGGILRYLRDKDEERDVIMKRDDYDIMLKLNKMIDRAGRDLTYEELAQMSGVDVKRVEQILSLSTSRTRIETIVTDHDKSLSVGDMIRDDFNLEDTVVQGVDFKKVLNKLTSFEREIVQHIFIDDRKQKELVKVYGCQQSYISRMVVKTRNKLKDLLLEEVY